MRVLRRISVIFAALLFLTGCASSDDGFSASDIGFAEMMIPHHQQAIEMSDLALERASNAEVLALAEQIKAAQAPEIETMSSWPGVNAGAHSGHMMDGMLTEEEMQQLRTSSGTQFDRLFLEGMIKHHQGAVMMASGVQDSTNAEVAELARAIIAAQEEEIRAMEELLSRL